jgi:hypothetical protein
MLWALLIIFWALVPGLITGWMFRERGRRFAPGFLLGIVCGPLGILGSLAFIYISDRRQARGRARPRGRAVRVFYDVPVVGRLHVSTVWALAGIATFLCVWMVGGVVFELQRDAQAPASSERADARPQDRLTASGLPPSTSNAGTPAADSKISATSQSNTSAQQQAALLGISVQPAQPSNSGAHAENSPAPSAVSSNTSGTSEAPAQPSAGSAMTPTPSVSSAATPTPASKVAAPTRDAAVSEATRVLSSMGHRVHAALSGEGRSTTLSLSGATLTRQAGSQLLGNGQLRGSLKAAGVRIVVMVNGQESWTYIL